MAIRIPDQPALAPDDGFRIQKVDPRQAAAPAVALGAVADAFKGASETFNKIGIQAQQQVNTAQVLNTQSDWRRQAADFSVERDKITDPTEQIKATNDFLAKLKGTVDSPDYAPAVRDQLSRDFTGFSDQVYIQGKQSAANMARGQAETSAKNALQLVTDPSQVRPIWEQAHAAGIASDQDLPMWEATVRKKQQKNQQLIEANENPYQFMQDKEGGPKAGEDPIEHYQMVDEAKRAYSNEVVQTTNDFHDQVALGNITNDSQLDAWVGEHRVSPRVKEQYRDFLKAQEKDRRLEAANDPNYQARVVGDVSARISNYSIDGDNYDENYVGIKNQIVGLPQGPMREELTNQLEEARTGQKAEVKSNVDQALRDMDQANKSGMFGSGTGPATLQQIVDDGYLADQGKMLGLGFTPEQAKALATLDKGDLTSAGIPADRADAISKGKTNSDRIEAFRTLFHERRNTATAPSYELDVADTLRRGGDMSQKLTFDTPAAKRQRDEAYGTARMQMMDWARLNPDMAKDPQKVTEKLYEFSAPAARAKSAASLIEAPPELPDFGVLPPKPEKK